MLPKLSKKTGLEIHETFWYRMKLIALISTLLTLLYVFLTPYVFRLIFPLYPESIFYAQLLGAVLFLSLINAYLSGILQSRLDITPKKMLYWRITPRVVFICSLFILIPFYGILGAVIGRIILSAGSTVVFFIQYYLLYRIKRT